MLFMVTPAGKKVYKLDHEDQGLDYFLKIALGAAEVAYLILPLVSGMGALEIVQATPDTVTTEISNSPEAVVEADIGVFSPFTLAVDQAYPKIIGPWTALRFTGSAGVLQKEAHVRYRIRR